ncbi:hypothetical protein HDU97_010436 [Phlyctochytrium planicorne]|nr:hypothetical protein HDU97_010436 [Phlyctochytrium planicorne]
MLESKHEIKPLDLVLFKGDDAVARYIRKVTRTKVLIPKFDGNDEIIVAYAFAKQVIAMLTQPFHALWTHAGVLVDRTVLDHDALEPGKLYIYESVFSGKILGFEYSKCLPVDHVVQPGSYHLGPQIREFGKVVEEVSGQVAVCPLHPDERRKLEEDPEKIKEIVTAFHRQYSRWSYPLAPIKQLAAASEKLYNILMYLKSQVLKYIPLISKGDPYVKAKGEIFCSELVALLYRKVGIEAFADISPEAFTPVEVEAMPAFGGRCLLIKNDGKINLGDDGRTVLTSRQYSLATIVVTLEHANYWSTFTGTALPENVLPAGHDVDGTPLFVARARIGQGIIPGSKRGDDGVLRIPWEDNNPLKITYEHEMLTSMEGMSWVTCADAASIPADRAVLAGRDEEGRPLFVCKSEIKVGKAWWFKKQKSAVSLGNVRRSDVDGGAMFSVKGKVRRVKHNFEVLCFDHPSKALANASGGAVSDAAWKGLVKSMDKLKAIKAASQKDLLEEKEGLPAGPGIESIEMTSVPSDSSKRPLIPDAVVQLPPADTVVVDFAPTDAVVVDVASSLPATTEEVESQKPVTAS